MVSANANIISTR
jgi:hypothetical protein